MNIYDLPPNEIVLDVLYAILSFDENGNEGIIAAFTPGVGSMPMIFGHPRLLERALPLAKQMVKDTGKTLRVYKFQKVEMLEEIKE